MSSKSSQKPRWAFWYKGCTVQQIYAVISVIGALIIFLGSLALLFVNVKEPSNADSNMKCYYDVMQKFKYHFIAAIVIGFAISFFVSNSILVFYCNRMPSSGTANLLWSLFLFFIILPIINNVIFGGVMLAVLASLMPEIDKCKKNNNPPTY
jgi:hypothetical protein